MEQWNLIEMFVDENSKNENLYRVIFNFHCVARLYFLWINGWPQNDICGTEQFGTEFTFDF